MATEEINLRSEFIETIKEMPPSALAIYLVLVERSRLERATITLRELAHMCNLTEQTTRQLIDWLTEDHGNVFLYMTGTGTKRVIQLEPIWFNGTPNPIKISYEKLDKEIDKLEEHIRVLEREKTRAEVGDRDGIAEYLKGEERNVVLEICGYYGRALTPLEAYVLGQLIQGFGPVRTLAAFRQKKGNASPLKSAYWFLKNGGKGNAAKTQEPATLEKITYRNLDN